MKLKVDGDTVRGTYQVPGGDTNDIRGTLDGRKLALTYEETGITGEGSFTLANDELSFAGQGKVANRKKGGAWEGTRVKAADWAGSAVIDFSYLDLVLSRKMPPGEAVRQIQKSVTFAGETETPDCAIKPAGLKIVE